jgi:autotransporter-associated beta strand protein
MPKSRFAWQLVLVMIAIAVPLVGAGAAQACTGTFLIQTDGASLLVPNGGTVTIKGDAGNLLYDIGDTGTWYLLTASHQIDVDFDGCAGTVTFDGTASPISIVNSITVRDGGASSQLRVKGTIKTTDTGGQIFIAATVPTQLIGSTTFEGNAAGPMNVTYLSLAGPIDGAYPLTIAYGNAGAAGMSTVAFTGGVGATISPTTLAVDAGSARVVGTVQTSGVQTWSSSTTITLEDADATLRAPRVTQLGGVECGTCAATRHLTIDVTEASPGSTFNDLGSAATGPDEWDFQLVKDGAGTLAYGSRAYRSRYTGGTVVNAGTLRVTHANALSTGSVSVGAAGTLELAGVDVGSGGPITPSGFGLEGTLRSAGSASVMRVPITLLDDAAIIAGSTAPLDVTSYLAGGAHDVSVEGPVDFGAMVATTGSVRVQPATMWLPEQSLTTTGGLVVDGILELHAQNLTLAAASLSGAATGQIRCASPGGPHSCGQLAVDVSGSGTFAGAIGGGMGLDTARNFSLLKDGSGLVILTGANAITGTTSVERGELHVTGSIGTGLSTGNVSVASGATLSGSGDVGGTLAGDGLGLSVSGRLALDTPGGPQQMTTALLGLTGGTFAVGVDSAAAHSQLLAASGYVWLIAEPALSVRAGTGLAAGDVVTIVRKTHPDAIVGTFAGLPEGAIVTPISGAGTFRISYVGGDGNDITLTYIAPPVQPAAVTAPARASETSSEPAIRTAKPAIGTAGTLTTPVTVAGPGTIAQTASIAGGARAKAAVYCTAKLVVKRAGSYKVKCTPSKAMRARLRTGALKLRVTTTFAPKTGSVTSSTAAVVVPRRR